MFVKPNKCKEINMQIKKKSYNEEIENYEEKRVEKKKTRRMRNKKKRN